MFPPAIVVIQFIGAKEIEFKLLRDLPPLSLHNKIGLFSILMKPGNGELLITAGETYRSLHIVTFN